MLANEDNDKPLGKQDYLGWALWATGMFFEIVADMQKTSFKNDPKNQVSKMFKKNYNLWCFKLLTGKIHHYWLMVYQSSSQLFWRNHAMVWFVHICFFCLQRMAVFGCTQSIVCAFAYHQTKWYSIAGKGRLEKMGTLEGVSRIFEKYTFFGAFLEINVYWRATLSREKARKIQNSLNKKWTISDF